jgi:AraC-like DNA-binding protein
MQLTYYDINKTSHLIKEFYHISYSKKILPFKTKMIPLGFTGFTYVYSDGQKTVSNKKINVLKDLVLNGQFYKSYEFIVEETGFSCGLNFKPTALHKLTNLDVSKFTNKNLDFNQIDPILSTKIEEICKNNNQNFEKLFQDLENLLIELPLIENKNTIAIDKLIDLIHEKEGMLSVNELLINIPFGQKTLETQFKKIVGLTPAKYIRLHRFLNLMRQFEKNIISLKDLIYMYDYFDESHFYRDFKSFTSNTPKQFFKDEYVIVKKALQQ